jgi:hypothetical protein
MLQENMINNIEVISYKFAGNSFPIVIKHNNKKFLVKLRAGLSGEYSLLCEWFGNRIGREIGINTQQPFWIFLTKSMNYKDIYIEVRQLIDKSLGVNIGFEYIENVSVFDLTMISQIEKEEQIRIYLLDLLMLNIDRTTKNHNLLQNDQGILVTDYDSSLIFNDLIKTADLSMNMQILQCLKLNPFYQKINDSQLNIFLNRVNNIDFEKIIFEIPDELIDLQNKEMICKRIENKKNINWNLRKTLDSLEKTDLETDKDRRLRISRNREKLEKFVNSTRKRGG